MMLCALHALATHAQPRVPTLRRARRAAAQEYRSAALGCAALQGLIRASVRATGPAPRWLLRDARQAADAARQIRGTLSRLPAEVPYV